MHKLVEHVEDFKIWRKGLELAETIQKMTEDFSSSVSRDIWSILRNSTLSIPSYLVEGFMMKNIKDRKNYFYRALNCLDELLKSLVISEQMGYLPEALTNKIKKEISDLNRLIFKRIKHRQQVFS
jgi:four helix bundle protein